jgi:hypothetical protein
MNIVKRPNRNRSQVVRLGALLRVLDVAVFKLRGSVSYCYRYEYIEGVVRVLMVIPAK